MHYKLFQVDVLPEGKIYELQNMLFLIQNSNDTLISKITQF